MKATFLEHAVPETIEDYRAKVAGTNIDQRSLLSTDYFNTFNSVIMLLDMLPDAPDLLEEAEQWEFYDYVGHFRASGLDFADLAIAAYEFSPPDTRAAFERKINGMRIFLVEVIRMLRVLRDAGETGTFNAFARMSVTLFHGMMDEASGIVHGSLSAMNQAQIDNMF